MSGLLTAGNILLPLLYIATLVLYVRHFVSGDEEQSFLGSTILYGTLGLHTGYLAVLGVETGHFPIASRSEFFSLLALSVGTIYAFAERRHDEANTGPFFIAIVCIFQIASSWMAGDPGVVPDRSRNPVYGFHVIFTVFGFAGLTLSSLYSLMYILLNRQLKSHELGLIFKRLPPLQTLENMSKVSTAAGVILLGIGLALGHYVAAKNFSVLEAFSNPIIVVADIAWLAYAVGLGLAQTKRLTGVRLGYLSIGGYLVLMASLVVVLTQFGAFHTFQ